MGNRFSPTVNPVYYNNPGVLGHLSDVADEVMAALEARREKKKAAEDEARKREFEDLDLAVKGVYRGTAPGAEVNVRPSRVEDVPLPPSFNPAEEHPLTRSRSGMDTLRQSAVARGETVPGGGFAGDRAPGTIPEDASMAADMMGQMGDRGRPTAPPPPKVTPPGAYNPIRGTFEPAVSLPTGGLELDTTAAPAGVRQLTDNYYMDENRTPAGRERAMKAEEKRQREQDLIQFWIDQGEPPDSARRLATMEMLDPGIGPKDVLGDREDEASLEGNRDNWIAYNERLRAMDEPEVPFDPRTNWSQQAVNLSTDVRSEEQYRTRPRTGPSERVTGAEARALLDDIFGGVDDQGRAVPGTQVISRADYNRYYQGLTSGELTIDEIVAEADRPEQERAQAVESAATGFFGRGTAAPAGDDAATLAEQAEARFGSAEAAIQAIDAAGGPDSERAQRAYDLLRQRAGR